MKLNSIQTRLIVLVTVPVVFLIALTMFNTMRSNKQIIGLQARKLAQTVATQVITDRKHYVQSVVTKLKGTDFASQEGYTQGSSHVPLPATFVMNVAADISSSQDEYRYQLISRWNINKANALDDPFYQRAFDDLIAQEHAARKAGQLSANNPFTQWEPYWEYADVNGRHTLRYVSADVAAGMACVNCHNTLEQRTDIIAMRSTDGVEQGHVFQLNDLMGAVAVEVDLEEATGIASAGMFTMGAWVIGVLILSNWLVRRWVTRPIGYITERVRDIAVGEADLTQQLDVSRDDELGQLSQWFNMFVKRIHDVVTEVSKASRDVANATQEIQGFCTGIAAGTDEQSQQIMKVSSAAEEMSASINNVAIMSADAASSADNSGATAQEGGRVVQETINGMTAIRNAVSASSESVSQLGIRGEQIGEVIAVINDIADQTNLLALNAAIEAARAGEYGRGFAVVADEVRKLADRTTQATTGIGESIQAIQVDTQQAVTRMASGNEQVQTGVQRAESAGQSLAQIVSSAQDVSTMVRSIAAASKEQAAASTEVSSSIELIAQVTRQTSKGSAQAAEAGARLAERAETLQRLVGQFVLAEHQPDSRITPDDHR